ncbi:MAG: Rne/Rng family ribonuclease, partial [Rhodobacteraceae bacterium]|nr:Rne/Rng family ribonuclease [Paracoccaceae bacterium]
MSNALLVDATYEGESRIVALENGQIQELYYEISDQDPIVGNIYLAVIERVEPSLEAAFVDYGASRHGFLSIRQLHPSFYRKAGEVKADGQWIDNEILNTSEPKETVPEIISGSERFSGGILDLKDYSIDFAAMERVSQDDFVSTRERQPRPESTRAEGRSRKSETLPRIETVLHPGQVILVQISKDEVNAKGAALTTYLSLPGRYCVLLPLSGRGCEISKKITDRKTRNTLRSIYESLVVPEHAGVIMRSVLNNPDRDKIAADFNYLMTQWAEIQKKIRRERAPGLIHTEGTIIHRILRDLDTRMIDKIVVDGESGYQKTQAAVGDMMPEILPMLQRHDSDRPLFFEEDIEQQLFMLQQPRIDLKSGGQIVIEQTEALVSIDVNSAKASQGSNVEETALQTNIEAAVEVARQLRLRDLAGIIVIDFIDMNEQRHRNEVKRVLNR